jgi:hypothetical protein
MGATSRPQAQQAWVGRGRPAVSSRMGGAPSPPEGAGHDVVREAEVPASVVDHADAVEEEVRPQEAEVPEPDVVTLAEGPAPAEPGVQAVAAEGESAQVTRIAKRSRRSPENSALPAHRSRHARPRKR